MVDGPFDSPKKTLSNGIRTVQNGWDLAEIERLHCSKDSGLGQYCGSGGGGNGVLVWD